MTDEYRKLTGLERKVEAMQECSCQLSLNAMSLSVAVDACRGARYFGGLLKRWEECLPLGDANDVDFGLWSNKVWDMMKGVQYVYGQNHVQVNLYEYGSEPYQTLKERVCGMAETDDSLAPLQEVQGRDVAGIVMCALRELQEVLMRISEFMGAPTEELIGRSFELWRACYRKYCHGACQKRYSRWKVGFSERALKKKLKERVEQEMEAMRALFMGDDEWEMVYDAEQKVLDYDGLSRFLFTHAKRYGVSCMAGERPVFSTELLELFNHIDLLRMMQADLSAPKRRVEKQEQKDDLETKVLELVAKVNPHAEEKWQPRLGGLWQRIFRTFRADIAQAGAHEKFKDFSKKTVYCIIGHLRKRDVYRKAVTCVDMTKALEGENNGMRKYLNNGLSELTTELGRRIKTFVEQEIKAVA
ncbi:MAG: hypothetical protein II706_04330 [Bacteroidaceae bacterium]|nr:hypothetical protein [Bacteroidaceae bacterium]